MTALPDSVAAFARQLAATHAWHAAMQTKPLHPAVLDLLVNHPLPEDWRPVVLEWPHVADNPDQLAYTPNEEKALKGIVVNLSPAKYLRKHWTDLSDHSIRDTVAKVANAANFRWLTTSDEIVNGVQKGPRSCMQKPYFDHDGQPHPYRVYAPELGWSMAIRLGPEGRIDGRALVYNDGKSKVFVRSYQRTFEKCYHTGKMVESYSIADTALEAWLYDQGVDKDDGWADGTKLARVEDDDGNPQLPYLDGSNDRFNFVGDHIVIESGGRNCADCQDGSYSEDSGDWRTCYHCGERFDADEGEHIYIGCYEDDIVGECCRDEYTYVRGRSGQQYYVYEDNVVMFKGQAYHDEYLEDNGIVTLADGDYAKDEDAVYCEWDCEYHLAEDCVDTEDENWVPREDAWQCAGSGDWYSTNTASVEIDGQTYHPDHAPDDCDEEDDDPVAPMSDKQMEALDSLLAA